MESSRSKKWDVIFKFKLQKTDTVDLCSKKDILKLRVTTSLEKQTHTANYCRKIVIRVLFHSKTHAFQWGSVMVVCHLIRALLIPSSFFLRTVLMRILRETSVSTHSDRQRGVDFAIFLATCFIFALVF